MKDVSMKIFGIVHRERDDKVLKRSIPTHKGSYIFLKAALQGDVRCELPSYPLTPLSEYSGFQDLVRGTDNGEAKFGVSTFEILGRNRARAPEDKRTGQELK